MPIIHRVAKALGLAKREAATMPAGLAVPARSVGYGTVSADAALSLSTIYRAVQILTTAACQVTFHAHAGGRVLDGLRTPLIVKAPSASMENDAFIEYLLLSLIFHGNAYLRINTDATGKPLDVDPLNPAEVRPFEVKNGAGEVTGIAYGYRGKTYDATQIKHLHMLKLPGRLTGLGPIQAAQIELRGALELRDYAALWFSEGKIPSGILTSEQILTPADAAAFKSAWNESTAADNPSGVKVFGKGTTYTPIMLKPADAQWLESQQFTTTQLARLFGVPASLMLAAVEGSAMTYSNVEQDWIAFTRFTLIGYLGKIETALSSLVVRGTKVKFNLDSLLRSDTKTRYEAHKIGIDAGFLLPDEVRELEGRPALTPEQREQIAASKAGPAPAPTEESEIP